MKVITEPDQLRIYVAEKLQARLDKLNTVVAPKVAEAIDAAVALNHAKWAAAMAYCKKIGCAFRVITEDDLFYKGKRK